MLRTAPIGPWLLLSLLGAPAAAQEPPAAPAAATPALTLSFEEALARALERNLAVGRARAEVDAAKARTRAALSLVLPRLGVTGSLVRYSDEVSFGSGEDRFTVLPRNDWAYQITLNQPVFAGLREKRAYDQAKAGVARSEEGLRAAQDGVLLDVGRQYLAAVASEALVDVERRNLELAERRRKQARALFEAGETTRVDALRAEANIKAAERQLVAAQRARQAAEGGLRVLLALDGPIVVHAPSSGVLPPLPDPASLMRRAEAARPEVKRAEQDLRIARLEVSKQKGAYLPVLTADAGYVRQKRNFPKAQYGYAALRFNVPLFQGREVEARVAEARLREQQAELALDETRRQVHEDVRIALVDREAAEASLRLAQEQLTAAEADYAQTFELYRSQEVTALDLESSEVSLASSRRGLVEARLDRALAELGAWYAAGSLKAAVLKEVVP